MSSRIIVLHRTWLFDRLTRRDVVKLLGGGALSASLSGCGTILYPDRIGQTHGPLDWKVVALDTVGLLLFLVPGVIAFVVDFHNGTIYLPPEQVLMYGAPVLSRKVGVEWDKLTLTGIEAAVQQETGVALELTPGAYVTRELKTLADYPAASQQLALDLKSGILRCQSPDR
jgi:hypothetical protein